jgi:hypothetical protein
MTNYYHVDGIGSIYSARTTELIYRELRSQLDTDEDVEESITKIMQEGVRDGNAPTRLERIREHYDRIQRLKRGRFLEEVKNCFELDSGQVGGHNFQDQEVFTGTKTSLNFEVGVAKTKLKETLADRT